jgi:tRNA threonylcarbamoyladenosine biosynthesis protein TsaE
MSSVNFTLKNEDDTIKLGKAIAGIISPGDVIGLCGDLGAGKTFLCRVIAFELGVQKQEGVNSPTFTLINEYLSGKFPIYHMDFYRLNSSSELYDLGLWDYYNGKGICLVEWYDKFKEMWPEDAILINFKLKEEQKRIVEIKGEGKKEQFIKKLQELEIF